MRPKLGTMNFRTGILGPWPLCNIHPNRGCCAESMSQFSQVLVLLGSFDEHLGKETGSGANHDSSRFIVHRPWILSAWMSWMTLHILLAESHLLDTQRCRTARCYCLCVCKGPVNYLWRKGKGCSENAEAVENLVAPQDRFSSHEGHPTTIHDEDYIAT